MENQVVISEKAQMKLDLLQKASIKLFNNKGFHQTRIEDIITEAQVGKGTFYLYFGNKEELVLSILEQLLTEVNTTLDWVQLNIADVKSLRNLFIEEAKKLTETFIKNQEAAKFLFREAKAVSREVELKINQHMNNVIKASEDTYAFALSMGILENVNPKVAAMGVVGGIIQIYQQWLDGQIDEDINKIIEKTVDFYLRALGLTLTA